MAGDLYQKSTPTRFGPALFGTFDSLAVLLAIVFFHLVVFPITQNDIMLTFLLWPLFEFMLHKIAHERPIAWHIQHHRMPFEAKLSNFANLEYSSVVGYLLGWWLGIRWFQMGSAWYGVTHALIHEGLFRNTRLFQHHRIHHACGASKFSVVAPIIDYAYDSFTR